MADKQKKAKNIQDQKKEICFIIMPFSTNWSEDYYKELYCPAVKEAGLDPRRADDLFAPNTVVEDIWDYTQKAQIILADLTGKNPNVFYELGLAHAIAKPVILVTESEEDIPFDLRAIRIIKYNKNKHDWGEKLKTSITQSIKEILKNPEKSIPSPFLKTSKSEEGLTVTNADKRLIELEQEVELLKKSTRNTQRTRDDIGPDAAKVMIREYIRKDLPDTEIMSRLIRLGPPSTWIRTQIEKERVNLKNIDEF